MKENITGMRIKALRIQQKCTQEELAQAANTTKQTIYKYENGIITNIPSDKIKAIAEKLNTTPAYLLDFQDDRYEFFKGAKTNVSYNQIILNMFLEVLKTFPKFDFEKNKNDYDIFEVKDDKMYPHYKMSDRIIIKKVEQLTKNGKIALVLYKNEKILRSIEFNDDKTCYKLSCNVDNVPPIIIKKEDFEVIGIPFFVIRDENIFPA